MKKHFVFGILLLFFFFKTKRFMVGIAVEQLAEYISLRFCLSSTVMAVMQNDGKASYVIISTQNTKQTLAFWALSHFVMGA